MFKVFYFLKLKKSRTSVTWSSKPLILEFRLDLAAEVLQAKKYWCLLNPNPVIQQQHHLKDWSERLRMGPLK